MVMRSHYLYVPPSGHTTPEFLRTSFPPRRRHGGGRVATARIATQSPCCTPLCWARHLNGPAFEPSSTGSRGRPQGMGLLWPGWLTLRCIRLTAGLRVLVAARSRRTSLRSSWPAARALLSYRRKVASSAAKAACSRRAVKPSIKTSSAGWSPVAPSLLPWPSSYFRL